MNSIELYMMFKKRTKNICLIVRFVINNTMDHSTTASNNNAIVEASNISNNAAQQEEGINIYFLFAAFY